MTSARELRPHLTNAFFAQDRISAACDPDVVGAPQAPGIYADPWYGNAWSWTPPPGAAVYGRTGSLPPTPIEESGNGTFLRVPYRRVPYVDIRSPAELVRFAEQVQSKNPDVRGVWRGQWREYQLERTDDDRSRLYGDVSVSEPSLRPSASRETRPFPSIFGAWSGLLDLWIAERVATVAAAHSSRADYVRDLTASFSGGYNYRLWGLATAQHYGLPSVGLDVTTDILVALYFALHKAQVSKATGGLTVERADRSATPVIYGLAPFKHDLLEDAKLAPAWLQCARPQAQKAFFFGTAWGAASNKAADRLWVALRLVGHADWISPLTAGDVFPNGLDDPFVAFMIGMRGKTRHPVAEELLSRIYFRP